MSFNLITNIANCYYDIPSLVYYAHIPTAIAICFIGFFVFLNNRKSLSAKILFSISVFFSLWIVSDIIIFINPDSRIVMFFWSLVNVFEISVSLLTLYFAYVFLEEKDITLKLKFASVLLVSPLLFLSFTNFNLNGFDTVNCEAVQGPLIYYFYIIESFIFLCLLIYLIKKIYQSTPDSRKIVSIFSFGAIFFILSFSGTNIIASLTQDWHILMYGLISAPIFSGILAYLIVQFHTFHIKLIATQALVWSLVILIGSQFFFIKVPINMVLNSITFIATIIFGHLLIKSVKKEVEQKEELAKLNLELQDLIKQRESLVHLVTHKVKGSFTRSKYIFAEILDGTFGEINDEVKRRAQQGLESENMGIETVDLVLNVANMQKGTVKYDMKNIDLKEVVIKTISEKKDGAEMKGLKIESEVKPARNASSIADAGGDGVYNVLGDQFWLKEVVNNLIENSIKYTKEGKITVGLEKNDNPAKDGASKIKLFVKDTGVGITPDDKKNLFTEGGRGKDSVKVNVDSTGYGLYSVKLIVDAHKGRVWAESEGPGRGSQFYVELDAA